MNLNSLSERQRGWLLRNPQLLNAALAGIADRGLEFEAEKKKRKQQLLSVVRHTDFVGGADFSLRKFMGLGVHLPQMRIRGMHGSFREWFWDKQETDVSYTQIYVSQILDGSREVPYATEPEIRERIGEENLDLSLVCVFNLLARIRDFPNRAYSWYGFYARDVQNERRVIHAEFCDGWHLSAVPVGYPDELRNGGCVISKPFQMKLS